MKSLFILLLLTLFGSCSSLENVDRSKINHAAMEFDNPLLPSEGSFLTNLNNFDEATGGGGCTTCSK